MATYQELKEAVAAHEAKAAELMAQAEAAHAEELAAAIEQCKGIIALFGITSAQLGLKAAKPAKRKAKPATNGSSDAQVQKYRSPVDGTVWPGRGRKPLWFVNATAEQRAAARV